MTRPFVLLDSAGTHTERLLATGQSGLYFAAMRIAYASYLPDFVHELFWGAFFAFAILILISGWQFLRTFPIWFRSIRSANWAIAEAKIETVKVSAFAGQSLAQAAYSYVVEGHRHPGYLTRQFVDEQEAWDYLRPLQGQSILVRYKPANPGISAVRSADQSGMFAPKPKSFVLALLSRSALHVLGQDDWRFLHLRGLRHWPITKGRIEIATAVQKRIHETWYLLSYYDCQIDYSYSLRGEYYAGSLERTFFSKRAAQKFNDGLKGKDIFVRYNSDSPDVSVVLGKDQQGGLLG